MKKEKDCRSHKKGLEKRGKWKRLFLPPFSLFTLKGGVKKFWRRKGKEGKTRSLSFSRQNRKMGKNKMGKFNNLLFPPSLLPKKYLLLVSLSAIS